MYADATETAETSLDLLREFERTGDSVVFETFMRRHAAMVYATCLKVTRDPHDAEDATQATFLTLASKSRLNGEIRQPEAWLRKVAHRLSLDLIRSKKRRSNRENVRSEMTNEAAPLDSSDHADNGEVKGILNEELAKLPASYRMPLILHYFGGLSREEMAEQLKLKPSTLGVRLHRAREQLRKRLATRGVAVPTLALAAMLTDAIRSAVSAHMVSATAQQASVIAGGSLAPYAMSSYAMSASLPFAAGPSASMFSSVLATLARSKVKLVASTVILGSIIGVSNAKVQALLPAALRAFLPTFSFPSFTLPTFEHVVTVPTFGQKQIEPASAVTNVVAYRPDVSPARPVLVADALPIARAAAPQTVATELPRAGVESIVASSPPMTLARIDVGLAGRLTPQAARAASSAFANASRLSFASSSIGMMSSANASTSSKAADAVAPSAPIEGGGFANWGSIIPDHGDGPFIGGGHAGDDDAASPRLVAAVTGASPLTSGGGGGGGATPQPAKGHSAAQAVGRSRDTSRTAIFAGTSANYGGYADDAWKSTSIADLSKTIKEKPTYSFDQPAAPTSGLSINGARVTLHGTDVTGDPTIQFIDPTNVAALPTLPSNHHFIGAWSLATAGAFDTADILVRYDDLRAARLGLSEQILKLWVSDGTTWTLLWHDPTFGRDIDANLIWVTAHGPFKYFAVSAPEPTLGIAIAGALAAVTRRRRRR